MDTMQQPQQPISQQQMPASPMPQPLPTQPSYPPEEHKSYFFRDLSLFILFLIIVGGAAYGGYYYGQKTAAPAIETTRTPLPTQPVATASPTLSTANWKTYTNQTLGYSLQYPPDWTVNPNYADPQGSLGKEAIALSNPQGDMLLFDYGYRPLGVPPHVFKTQNLTIVGQPMIKTYNDGCGFDQNGLTAITQCKGKTTEFYQITYSTPDGLSNDPTVVDSTPGTRDYAWSTGTQSVGLGMNNFHGKPSYLAFLLKKRLTTTDTSFQATDAILDKITASLQFTK